MIRDDNEYVLKAMHCYENSSCIAFDEFKEDLNRVTTIRKCISKYLEGEELNVRLVLNHFIVVFNVFGSYGYDLLKYKLEPKHYPIAWAFLIQLERLPVDEVILLDQNVVNLLRQI
jgi:hypothetical protein